MEAGSPRPGKVDGSEIFVEEGEDRGAGDTQDRSSLGDPL
jgi:hypothetical protein